MLWIIAPTLLPSGGAVAIVCAPWLPAADSRGAGPEPARLLEAAGWAFARSVRGNRIDEAHAVAPDRFQVVRRADRFPDRAGIDRRRRAERLRQVEPRRSAALGDGRGLPQGDARRRHGRRDLLRQQQSRAAQHRRSGDDDRQQRPRGARPVQRRRRARSVAPHRARRGLDLPAQRPRGARARHPDPVRRRLHRRALAGAGAPGPHRRDHPGQARAAPPGAGRGRRHFRTACQAPRGGAAAARRGAELGAAGGRDRPARRPDRRTQAPGPPGRALPRAVAKHPQGRGGAVSPAPGAGQDRGDPGAKPPTTPRCARWPTAPAPRPRPPPARPTQPPNCRRCARARPGPPPCWRASWSPATRWTAKRRWRRSASPSWHGGSFNWERIPSASSGSAPTPRRRWRACRPSRRRSRTRPRPARNAAPASRHGSAPRARRSLPAKPASAS